MKVHLECLKHKLAKWHFKEVEVFFFFFFETFKHSLVGPSICKCQHYFLIVKIASCELEIPIARVSSYQTCFSQSEQCALSNFVLQALDVWVDWGYG